MQNKESAKLYLFTCNSQTYTECIQKGLFGAPEKLSPVLNIVPGDICFLYHRDEKQVQGIWEATTSGQANIDPTAWRGKFPHQVRIKLRSLEIQTVPIDLTRNLIEVSPGKPHFELRGEKAQNLLKLFTSKDEGEIMPGIPLQPQEADYRNKFPAHFLCSDGHRVRSLSEKTIDDWLANRRIFHAYEPLVFIEDEIQQLIPDFCIYDKNDRPVYIEFWGMESDPVYRIRMEKKRALYAKYNYSLLELRPLDLQTIDAVMHRNFQRLNIYNNASTS